jgi:hypothetical protein
MGGTLLRIDDGHQRVGWKIALCGVALMLVGVAFGGRIHFEISTNTAVAVGNTHEIVPLVPTIAGAVLTFLGAIRISLVTRPLRLGAFGLVLVAVATAFPFVAVQLLSEIETYERTVPSLALLFTLRVVGLIFVSTAFLRFFVNARGKN